jgi:PAS domain S-box-containing protein
MSMIVSAAVLVCASAGFIEYGLVSFRRVAAAQLATNADIIAINVTPAMVFNDPAAAADTLSGLRASPTIVAAAVYTSDGNLFAKYGAPNVPDRLQMTDSSDRMNENALIVLRRIVADGKPIGTIYIRSDSSEMRSRLRGYALIVFAVLAVSFALALAVSSALQKKIAAPLLALSETARTIASKRDYSVRALTRTDDEIGTLGDAFNDMLQQIEQQNATLQESERNFRELADAMPQIVWTSGGAGEPEYINRQWFDYTGVVQGPGEKFGFSAAAHPEDLQDYLDARAKSFETGVPFTKELRLRRASDDSYRWHLARALPVRDKDGRIIRWFGTFTDIDDQKRAEAAVREVNADLERRVLERTEKLTIANAELAKAEEDLRRFFTVSLEMLCIAGFDGYFKRLNPAWEKVLGYPLQELCDRPFLDFVHPDDLEATTAEAARLAEGNVAVRFENRYRCADGSYRWLLWNAVGLPDEEKIFAAASDITERKQFESTLQDRAIALEHANRELESF